jgi:CubicO group peptidase (beta-lactamase class C family)
MKISGRLYSLLITVAAGSSLYFFSESTSSQGQPAYYSPAKRFVGPEKKDSVNLAKKRDSLHSLSAEELNNCYVIDSFFKVMAYRQRFNGNVLIAHNGKVLYNSSFGYANYRLKTNLTDSSEFQLGSVSKQFTAVAIMMLKEHGKLNYSDSVQQYFPEFPYHGVTIQTLLDHRSGLPNYLYLCSNVCKDQNCLIDNMQVIDCLSQHKPPRYFRPDQRFNYSNTNYCVLAAIVEKISGMSFAEFMHKNVFNPLHMDHTFIYCKSDTNVPNRIQGYNANYNRSGIDFLDGVAGDKGVYSTTADLLKWDQALYGNSLVKQTTLKEAFEPHGHWVRGHNYGYGWWLTTFGGDTLTYHDGWWHGFNCAFIRDRKYHNTIIVLSNHVNWCINRSRDLLNVLRETLGEDIDKSTDSNNDIAGEEAERGSSGM